jgi:hypothetical protein
MNNVAAVLSLSAYCRCDSEVSAPDAPAYVEASAPKQQRPTMCLTQEEKGLAFSCDAAQANQQRLCVCEDNITRL